MASNIDLLTRSHGAVKAKRRQKREQIASVVFDDDARREFLTGFHKRKVAKKEEGRKRALEREKQEHLESRREQRRMLAEQAAENAAKVEEAYGGFVQATESDDEWNGIASSSNGGQKEEAQYSDEEQLATVTIVEDFDPSTLIHGPASEPPDIPSASSHGPVRSSHKAATKETDALENRKKHSTKKIRYETKAARKAAQSKQRARRTEKAELAGGKVARKKGVGKKRR
ncbi:nucleolar protein 12-domain-containing protein [Gloeopeniophorella convolvens]|nr:nucleolar protein 12-domain-containing protein [Gloeopeniophorella convolvens]